MKDAAHDDYVFRTKRRRPWDGNDVVHEFHKLVVKAKATSPGFYSLRHTFATVAHGSRTARPWRRLWATRSGTTI